MSTFRGYALTSVALCPQPHQKQVGGLTACLRRDKQSVSTVCTVHKYKVRQVVSAQAVFETVSVLPSLIWFLETTTFNYLSALMSPFSYCDCSAPNSGRYKKQSASLCPTNFITVHNLLLFIIRFKSVRITYMTYYTHMPYE
jgi:hypothetical protein